MFVAGTLLAAEDLACHTELYPPDHDDSDNESDIDPDIAKQLMFGSFRECCDANRLQAFYDKHSFRFNLQHQGSSAAAMQEQAPSPADSWPSRGDPGDDDPSGDPSAGLSSFGPPG